MITKDLNLVLKELRASNVVAIPTETVYGLAGRIDSEEALKKIFAVKERPFFDPLIVHVSSKSMAKKYTKVWPEIAEHLADRFWPGPLTMILPKNESVNSLISSGLDTVGLRCPDHPLTLDLIAQLKVPLAAPSANKFGKTSPTKAEHVASEFPQERIAILDGGPCQIGLESTVLLVRANGELSILRPGAISEQQISAALTEQKVPFRFVEVTDKKESPGHMKHHYMPSVPLIVVHRGFNPNDVKGSKPFEIVLSKDVRQAFRELYQKLRDGSDSGADVLWIQWQAEWSEQSWLPLVDRLTKAATSILK